MKKIRMLDDMSHFLKNIRNIHTKSIILRRLYFQNMTENKMKLNYGTEGYSIVKI